MTTTHQGGVKLSKAQRAMLDLLAEWKAATRDQLSAAEWRVLAALQALGFVSEDDRKIRRPTEAGLAALTTGGDQ